MVTFHSAYHLNNYNYISLDFYNPNFWYYFPRFIVFLFLLCVGLALGLTHLPKPNANKFIKREIKLGLSALLISVSTYFAYPDQWVYFGTLHCIFFASLMGFIFIKQHRVFLFITFALLIFSQITKIDIFPIKLIFKHPSLDYIPLFPWVWVTFLGITLSQLTVVTQYLKQGSGKLTLLEFLGQHSLLIYLTHHGIILAILWTYTHLI